MKIDKFVESLSPTLVAEDLLEDNRVTAKELDTVTGPIYKSAVTDYFNRSSFKSDVVNAYDKEFKKVIKGGKNLVQQINDAIEKVEETVELVADLIESNFSDTIATSGISYSQANIIQLGEYCAFFSRYSIRLLNFLTVHETTEYEDSGIEKGELKDSLSPAEIQWVQANLPSFLLVFPIVTQDVDKTTKALSGIPDIAITPENYRTLSSTVGENKLDPLATKYIPAKMNIFMYLGKWIAEGQVKRYNAAKEEKEAVELRLINLKSLDKGNPNPGIQKQIRYYESKAQRLQAEIAQMEKDYA